MTTKHSTLALIGGSGLYDIVDELENVEFINIKTPYGDPSDVITKGHIRGTNSSLLFLPRHGRGHRIAPSSINFRANICALKMLGATHVMSVTAVGSLKAEIAPGDVVIVNQFIDLTRKRASTFFDEIAAHVPFADPVCPILANALFSIAQRLGAKAHFGGTYVCMEGPQFSTRAESHMYRTWGASVVGMTNLPEAKLAREAQLPYATLALSTDYDCWHETEEAVNVEAVIATLTKNIGTAKNIARTLAHNLPDVSESPAKTALHNAIMTAPDAIAPNAREKLSWLLG